MRDYVNYNISITDDSTDKTIYYDDFDCLVESLIVKYDPSMIPSVEILLKTKQPQLYSNLTNLTCIVNTNDKISYKYNMGISRIKESVNAVQLKGFLCKYEDFSNISSGYLGDSISSSVSTLDIRQNINGLTDDIKMNCWMIQESKTHALIRILNNAIPNCIWSMTNDSINLIDLSLADKKELKDYIPPDIIEYIRKDNIIKDFNESSTNNIVYKDEQSGLSIATTLGKFLIDTNENESYLHNYSTSLINRTFMQDTVLKLAYSKIIPYDIGDVMMVDTKYYQGKSLIITSKIESYSINEGMSTVFLMSGISTKE